MRSLGRSPLTLRLLTIILLILGAHGSAAGQDTRAGELEQQQQARVPDLTPYEPNRAERLIASLENSVLGVAPVGVYPWLGNIYPTGWLAFGAGYRNVFADTGSVNVLGGWSLKNFRMTQGTVVLPKLADGRVVVQAHAKWLDAPVVPFFGLGQSSSKDDRASYRYREATVGARGDLKPVTWFSVGASLDVLDITTLGTGRDDSADRRLSPVQAPGLLADPTYFRSAVSAAIDWRQPPGYSGTGGLYRAEVVNYAHRDNGRYGFRQFEGEVVQLIPILRANWVIALRGLVTTTSVDDGREVPYFLMPSLGGSRNVRGYSTFRFRDRHRMLWSAEYRWTPARFVDMALFYDAGKVTSRTSDLDFTNLSSSYGIGMRVVSLAGTALRIEVARSQESAFSLIWTSSASF